MSQNNFSRRLLPLFVVLSLLGAPTAQAQETAADDDLTQFNSWGAAFISEPHHADRLDQLSQLTLYGKLLVKRDGLRRPLVGAYLRMSIALGEEARTEHRPAADVANDQRALFQSYQTVFQKFADKPGVEAEVAKNLFETARRALDHSGVSAQEIKMIQGTALLFDEVLRQTAAMLHWLHSSRALLDVEDKTAAENFIDNGLAVLQQSTATLFNPDLLFHPKEDQNEVFLMKHLEPFGEATQARLLLSVIFNPEISLRLRSAAHQLAIKLLTPTMELEPVWEHFIKHLPRGSAETTKMQLRDFSKGLLLIPQERFQPRASLATAAAEVANYSFTLHDCIIRFGNSWEALSPTLRESTGLKLHPIGMR